MKYADTGIVGANVEVGQPTEADRSTHKALANVVKEMIHARLPDAHFDMTKLDEPTPKVTLTLAHSTAQSPQGLPLNQESRGTIKLLGLLPKIFKGLENGTLVIIDEIDSSLHRDLVEELLKIFANSELNPKGAQLIATTHDASILRSQLIRRDQIWCVEKNADGSATLFPITDYQLRENDNLERLFIEGRFGGVPAIDTVDLEESLTSIIKPGTIKAETGTE